MNRNAKNILKDEIPIPKWWAGKRVYGQSLGENCVSVMNEETQKMLSPAMKKVSPSSVGPPARVAQSDPRLKTERTYQTGLPEKMTRTGLIEFRKRENIPDISYDLDGDGQVGGKDYFMSRRFDEGFKNYLTEEERKKAKQAIQEVSWTAS